MKLLMIGGDTKILAGEKGPFYSTLEELRQHWKRIDVICPKSCKLQVASCKPGGVEVFENVLFHPSPYGSKWLQPKWILDCGKQIILEQQTDVMTVHAYAPFLHALGALLLSRSTGVPHGLECHGFVDQPASTSDAIGKALTRAYLPFAIKAAAGTRVINTTMQQQLKDWDVDLDRVSVVPSFYWDKATWKPNPSIQKKYDAVFVGRIDKNKGLGEIIRAVASDKRLAISDKPALLVIGDGPEKESCENVVRKLGLEGQVIFKGWVKEAAEVANLIRSSKVLIMNSKSEGGPRVTLEAMACGVPVISTHVGVMSDVLIDGENGYFTNGDAEDIATKLTMLLGNDEKRKVMGDKAAQSLQQFDRQKLIEGYAEWMKGLVNTKKST